MTPSAFLTVTVAPSRISTTHRVISRKSSQFHRDKEGSTTPSASSTVTVAPSRTSTAHRIFDRRSFPSFRTEKYPTTSFLHPRHFLIFIKVYDDGDHPSATTMASFQLPVGFSIDESNQIFGTSSKTPTPRRLRERRRLPSLRGCLRQRDERPLFVDEEEKSSMITSSDPSPPRRIPNGRSVPFSSRGRKSLDDVDHDVTHDVDHDTPTFRQLRDRRSFLPILSRLRRRKNICIGVEVFVYDDDDDDSPHFQ